MNESFEQSTDTTLASLYDDIPEAAMLFVQQTFWRRIERLLPQVEVDEVRSIIGNIIIDDNEELFESLKNYLDVLRTYRQETISKYEKQFEFTRLSLSENSKISLLKEKIHTVMTQLGTKSEKKKVKTKTVKVKKKTKEKDPLIPQTPREEEVISFILNPKTPSRPQTPRERPLSRVSSSSGELVPEQALSQVDINELRPNLNFFDIDKITGQIREILELENAALSGDIEYITQIIDSEVQYESEASTFTLPSAKEIQDIETKLENMLSEASIKQANQKVIERLPSPSKKADLNHSLKVKQSVKTSTPASTEKPPAKKKPSTAEATSSKRTVEKPHPPNSAPSSPKSATTTSKSTKQVLKPASATVLFGESTSGVVPEKSLARQSSAQKFRSSVAAASASSRKINGL